MQCASLLFHPYEGESQFWLTFENGLLQEWCYSSDHPCDAAGGAHRGWLLVSEIQFLRGNGRVQAAGVVRNFLVWLQVEDSRTRLAVIASNGLRFYAARLEFGAISEQSQISFVSTASTSFWRLSLPTARCDGDEDVEITFGTPVCMLSNLPSCRLKVRGPLQSRFCSLI